MILLIDNYDSFSYNLYQMLGTFSPDIAVFRSDQLTIGQLEKMDLEAIVISPGPGYPKDAGISVKAVQHFSGKIPILGVCLGHQAIGEAFGGKVIPAEQPVHGKSSKVTCYGASPLFAGLPRVIRAARYHSLILEKESLPDCLQMTALDEGGQIMALQHKAHPTYGVQFHPESILTVSGSRILKNFLYLAGKISREEAFQTDMTDGDASMLQPYLSKVIDKNNLSTEEAYQAMTCIMGGGATNAQIGSFLTALRMKGETVEEITGFAKVMRDRGRQVIHERPVIDIVGTGGDLVGTFNISTTAAFVVAGAGVAVAKHGNRSVSSKSGAADVLEALGFQLDITPEQATLCLKNCGISFLFAPSFHGSMKYAAPARREIGVRSVFNILGPLANPASSDYIVLGVYDAPLMEKMAEALLHLGVKGGMLVHGEEGLDEISISDATRICEIRENKIIKYQITPEEFGLTRAPLAEVIGGTPQDNATITLSVLDGEEQGAKRDIVLLNAGCALYTAQAVDTILEGVHMAKESIDSGKAKKTFLKLKETLYQFSGGNTK